MIRLLVTAFSQNNQYFEFFCLDNMQKWLSWGYWTSPLMYAQTALSINEFLGDNWNRVCIMSKQEVVFVALSALLC